MRGQKFFPLVVIAAGLLAYHNSFMGGFVGDDLESILKNPTIRRLWPIWQCLSPPHRGGITVEGRPLINLSLAINYALGGYDVWGYHALNLTVHILAGLTLLGVVRRTLLQPVLRDRFGAAANELALATAVLWTVHPLQTESVTYMLQRAESIMGLFYLLTLYCFVRGVESQRARLWYGLSVIACALGVASKEVMVSAPLMVMLYDRAFVSGSFREAWRRHWPLYAALASTWILLGFVLASSGLSAHISTEAQHYKLTRWQHLVTQPEVILYYLRLSVWPYPLSMNHPWPLNGVSVSILLPTVAIVILLGTTAWAWRRNPVWGFVGAWFFLILAPSSSVIPLHDLISEHRMYLSLAAVATVVVMGLYSLTGRHSLAVFVVVVIGLGCLTWRRNQDYRSEVTLWVDTVAKFPNEPQDHYNLGIVLWKVGRNQEAIAQYEQALQIKPDFAGAHYNLGVALEQGGRVQEAIGHFEEAVRLNPDYAEAHRILGNHLLEAGKVSEAITHYEETVRLNPDWAEAHNNLGVALVRLGRLPEAVEHFQQALRIEPNLAEGHSNLAVTLMRLGKMSEAVKHFEQSLRSRPDDAETHYDFAAALEQAGKVEEAIGHYEEALRIKPDFVEAHYNLGVVLEQSGKIQEAVRHWEQALQIKPDFAEAQKAIGRLRAVR